MGRLLDRVMKYQLRWLETGERDLSRDALGHQKGRGNKWMIRIEKAEDRVYLSDRKAQ
jgi:hypothetical protein